MIHALNWRTCARIAAWSWVLAAAFASPVVAQENAVPPGAKAVTAPKTKTQAAPPAKPGNAVRTLQEINIEGEIAVPQVLFITSRENRRYRDGLGSRFRVSALDVARSSDRPTRLRVVTTSE
jgi:hypothetical protein